MGATSMSLLRRSVSTRAEHPPVLGVSVAIGANVASRGV